MIHVMGKVLKIKDFQTLFQLTNFINVENVEKEDIQDINTSLNGAVALLYWVKVEQK